MQRLGLKPAIGQLLVVFQTPTAVFPNCKNLAVPIMGGCIVNIYAQNFALAVLPA